MINLTKKFIYNVLNIEPTKLERQHQDAIWMAGRRDSPIWPEIVNDIESEIEAVDQKDASTLSVFYNGLMKIVDAGPTRKHVRRLAKAFRRYRKNGKTVDLFDAISSVSVELQR